MYIYVITLNKIQFKLKPAKETAEKLFTNNTTNCHTYTFQGIILKIKYNHNRFILLILVCYFQFLNFSVSNTESFLKHALEQELRYYIVFTSDSETILISFKVKPGLAQSIKIFHHNLNMIGDQSKLNPEKHQLSNLLML